MKHKRRLFRALLVSLACLAFSQPIYAADVMSPSSPSVTIMKKISENSNEVTQTTNPLAGAHYRLTRILPVKNKQIVATDPATYTIARDDQAFMIELVTDQNGQIIFADTEKLTDGAFLLEELAGDGIPTPAEPIAFSLPFTDATGKVSDDFVYEPKSGLTAGDGEPAVVTNSVPNNTKSGTVGGSGLSSIGSGSTSQKPSVIMQTSGNIWSISWTAMVLVIGSILSTVITSFIFLRKRWEGRMYE
ncbi:hypothetical protein [Enterococcus dongliensis]|uniref:hypothetical protein n=1 Tax=Enterococcus dongliensis TaxID=2559925 RepID=UPI0028920BB2|nr:hypothetical protein [Enterococcus dongliensis]MDT2703464.1 hypothetical protein [Enterococcus dongliensis]